MMIEKASTDLDQPVLPAANPTMDGAEENLKLEVATQWQLMWWKFRKHRLAMVGAIVIITYYLVAIFADFLAPHSPDYYNARYANFTPPQQVFLVRDGQFMPHVYANKFTRDPQSYEAIWEVDTKTVIPLGFFVRGEPHLILGLFQTDIHFFGPINPDDAFYLLGSDKLGQDIFSRLIHSSRVSLSVGLVGVFLSLMIGITMGGISGLKGGLLDTVIQRVIEIIMSVPHLPIIIAIAAFLPRNWPVVQVYFTITVLLALVNWTGIARVVRSKFLALREEDFIMAARLDGARPRQLIFQHMLPSFTSHIIASLTLSLPGMIIGETALSYLGVGLRPPAVSWGVMLQDAQQVTVLANHPWLIFPAASVIIIVLAFNFMGDGLRDAADPY